MIARDKAKSFSAMQIRARYDAALAGADNRKHWANADSLSPTASNAASVRSILRTRSRYEVANNSYARGIVLTIANDTIGTGPKLQLMTSDQTLNREIETAFADWAREINFAEKLRTMRMARVQDGEAFAVILRNPGVRHPVQIDLRMIEAEQVTAPIFNASDDDGIVFDEWGNPSEYYVLDEHPGGNYASSAYTVFPADSVIHYFRPDRPGQTRGIPEITPALPLFAQLRRFTLAVISAAEAAANFSGILYTDSPANGEASVGDAFDEIELTRNMLVTMPDGWKMGQIKPEQPVSTYAEFKREILNEIARCMNMVYAVASGDSSDYSYAGGRLDFQTYGRSVRVDQVCLENNVLSKILRAWFSEYYAVGNYELKLPEYQWFWDEREHVDPQKEASAQEKLLANNTTTLARECAKRGLDWQDVLRQRAVELEMMRSLGISQSPAVSAVNPEPIADENGDTIYEEK